MEETGKCGKDESARRADEDIKGVALEQINALPEQLSLLEFTSLPNHFRASSTIEYK